MNHPPEYPLPTILIGENVPALASRLSEILGEIDGIAVVGPVNTGDEAWALFDAHHPQCVVLDLELPGCPVLDVIAAMRARGGVVIVVLSAFENAEIRRRCMDAGADYFLLQFEDIERVLEIVGDLSGSPV